MPAVVEPGASVLFEELGEYCGAGVPLVCRGAASALVHTPRSAVGGDSNGDSDQPPAADAGWTFKSLERRLGTTQCTILHSDSSRFAYVDATIPLDGKELHLAPTSAKGTFSDFMKRVEGGTSEDDCDRRSRWYCQNGVPLHEGPAEHGQPPADLGFCSVDWGRVRAVRDACTEARMGSLKSAQLFASCRGVVSPLHYDALHNFFCQMSGEKSFLLWPPRATAALRPYPVTHPMDRRSQLDLRNEAHRDVLDDPSLGGLQVRLAAGDLLYLPPYWWHEVRSDGLENISFGIWLRGLPPPPSLLQPSCDNPGHDSDSAVWDGLLVGIGRNVESFVSERVRSHDHASVCEAESSLAAPNSATAAAGTPVACVCNDNHTWPCMASVDACLRLVAAKLADTTVRSAHRKNDAERGDQIAAARRQRAEDAQASTAVADVVETVANEVLQEFGPVLCGLCGSASSASQMIAQIVANGRLLW